MIIDSNMMNGEKIFVNTRDMKIFPKVNFPMRVINDCVTNVTNLHTFSTGSVDVVLAAVLLTHGHLLEFTGDVVGCAAVHIPVCVHSI